MRIQSVFGKRELDFYCIMPIFYVLELPRNKFY